MTEPLTSGQLARLVKDFPELKLHELHCHPDVAAWLREVAQPAPEPQFPFAGATGSLTGIPVIEKPGLGSGGWELYENGEMIKSGRFGREGGTAVSEHPEMRPWVQARVREITDEVTAAVPLEGTVEGELGEIPLECTPEMIADPSLGACKRMRDGCIELGPWRPFYQGYVCEACLRADQAQVANGEYRKHGLPL